MIQSIKNTFVARFYQKITLIYDKAFFNELAIGILTFIAGKYMAQYRDFVYLGGVVFLFIGFFFRANNLTEKLDKIEKQQDEIIRLLKSSTQSKRKRSDSK